MRAIGKAKWKAACGLLGCLAAAPAHAQRTEENVTTQSNDAFGRSVGNDRSGLYSTFEVRGFNPSEAGNVRLEGLYFDLIDLMSARAIEGNTIRVGLSAQRFPFPAPTGLVDYQLAKPGSDATLSVELDSAGSQIMGPGGNFVFRLPLDGKRLGLAGGAGLRQAKRGDGGTHQFRTYSILAAFRPADDAELLLFHNAIHILSDDARPIYFPVAGTLPPKVPREKYLGLDWTERNNYNSSTGAIARLGLGGGFRIEAGLFYSTRDTRGFADLLLGVMRGGPDNGAYAARQAVVSDDDTDKSLSGEFRLIKEWQNGDISHRITGSLRGRSRNRQFGGLRLTLVPPNPNAPPNVFMGPELWPEPAYVLPAKNEDRIRQVTGGLAYSLFLWGKASLDLGISKTGYKKTIDFADPLLNDPVTRDRPLLWNASASFALTNRLIAYAGYTRGQEDALIAPDIASNRAEAPPAIRTRQLEAGLRYGINSNLGLVAGVFSIKKPYYNLDPALRYRQLGEIENRGVELSLTGRLAPGLNIVGGALFLDPRISGEAVDAGQIGKRPVGQIRQRFVANLDWRSRGGKGPISFDIAYEGTSSRVADAANSFSAPARHTFDIGARYRFHAGKTRMVLRPQLHNAFDEYGWQVSSSGGFTPSQRRFLAVSLLADF